MIKNIEQAIKVQRLRLSFGKSGYAKAVRRFLLRTDPSRYNEVKLTLPVYWARVEK